MNITPLFSQLMIEPTEKKQVLVSDEATLCEYGKVIAVGPDVKNVKVGDVVGFLMWGVNHLDIEGVKYYFVDEDRRFLLGIIND